MKYYIDSCIWIDYIENRSDNFRPLGEWAFKFLKKIVADEDEVIISDHLIEELLEKYPPEKIESIIKIIPETLKINVKSNKSIMIYGFKIENEHRLHFSDALHISLAKTHDAIFITRDKHFELIDFIKIRKPEDLI